MAESLFHRKVVAKSAAPEPYELIEPEIVHLKKGYSVRHGEKGNKRMPLWIVVLGACGLGWLYLMDPIEHSWYKSEAIKDYLYLHNYGAGKEADELATSGILSVDEITLLNQQHGSYQDNYSTPKDAAEAAATILSYLESVKLLHAGRYEQLDPVGRMRYLLFIRTGLFLPTAWDFLDPTVNP